MSTYIMSTYIPKTSTEQHRLNDNWVLWFHEMNSEDWTVESYKKLAEISTIEEFWSVYNHIPSVINGMWFLMRKEHNDKPIYPLWEDPTVIDGGAWLFKIHKIQADNVWLDLSLLLIGETICDNPLEIMGLSISPKKYYVTIRVWNRDKNVVSKFLEKIENVDFNEAIYKAHIDGDN